MKPDLILKSALLVFVFGPMFAFADEPPQQAAKLDVRVRLQLDYLIYLPKDYDQQKSWPLLVFLHGSGERGNDLEKVKVHGPPKLIDQGKDFPCIVVSPQCPSERGWEPIELTALIDELERKYNIDPDRIYLTGLSMGGLGVWELANYIPNRIAAIAPICGIGEPFWTKKYTHVPVWAFVGAKDDASTVARTQGMVDEITKNGGSPKLTIYPEAGHDAWTQTYNNPEFYDWLFAQSRANFAKTDKKK
ncbi:dienelactone hydrolase family protein [Schlesneria sp. T3-172]|uniref:carboxylesterase family protein n=1 Tax=Schlesneria sphaerica TaxID=3373610 RepID=UPI0037C5477A